MTNGDPPREYGRYSLAGAQPISIPRMNGTKVDWFAPPPSEAPMGNGGTGVKRRRLSQRVMPDAKRRRVDPPLVPPPPPPPISSVGIMDIGQGNCNMLCFGGNPLMYYDVGYPLHFYVGSLPTNMRVNIGGAPNPLYQGPINNNAAGNLEVVLSHWDWDHWNLGNAPAIGAPPGTPPPLSQRQWTVPYQPIGGAALGFFNALPNVAILPSVALGGPASQAFPHWTIHNCAPPGPMAAAALMNNTGLAVSGVTKFPTIPGPGFEQIVLTGDANFTSLPVGTAFPFLMGMTAVHHGSIAHGASAGLPAPLVAGQGRVAYSCGARQSAAGPWVRPYGFPVIAAVANYNVAGWGIAPAGPPTPPNAGVNEATTAEGPMVNGTLGGPGGSQVFRGNIAMGGVPGLGAYGVVPFTIFPNALH